MPAQLLCDHQHSRRLICSCSNRTAHETCDDLEDPRRGKRAGVGNLHAAAHHNPGNVQRAKAKNAAPSRLQSVTECPFRPSEIIPAVKMTHACITHFITADRRPEKGGKTRPRASAAIRSNAQQLRKYGKYGGFQAKKIAKEQSNPSYVLRTSGGNPTNLGQAEKKQITNPSTRLSPDSP